MKAGIKKKKKKQPIQKKYLSFFSFVLLLLGTIGIVTFLHKSPSPICANSFSCISDLDGKYESTASTGEFLNSVVAVPPQKPVTLAKVNVLGATDAASKHIDVDLTNQHLYAYENDSTVMDFPISSGKWGKTPTGDFTVWIKLRYARMKGGDKSIGTFYDLPNVPYTMYFYNDQVPKSLGYGIHGAYWHHNFGHPMSHGCINVDLVNIEKLYNWATPTSTTFTTLATADNPGTRIHIYGVAPNE